MFKKFIVGMAATTVLALGSVAVAADSMDDSQVSSNSSGFYVRAEGGYDWASSTSKTVKNADQTAFKFGINTKKSDGFTGRVAAGYNLNQYFGVEVGYDYLSPITRLGTLTVDKAGPKKGKKLNEGTQKLDLYAFDVMAKGTLPIKNFYIFGEAGAAYVHGKYEVASITTFNTKKTESFGKSETTGFIRPKVGAGIGYNINDHLAVDVSYSYIFGSGKPDAGFDVKTLKPNDKKYLPGISTATVGLTYKF